jgi:hypothetical protein
MAKDEMTNGYLLGCLEAAIDAVAGSEEDDDDTVDSDQEVVVKAPGDPCEHQTHPVSTDPKGDNCWAVIAFEGQLVFPDRRSARRQAVQILEAIRHVLRSVPVDHVYRFDREVS